MTKRSYPLHNLYFLAATMAVSISFSSCQKSTPNRPADKPTLKKTMAEVYVEYDPAQHPGERASLAMTDVFELPAGGLEVVLDRPYRIAGMELLFEAGDTYRLELRQGDSVHFTHRLVAAFISAPDDLFPAFFQFADSTAIRATDNIRIVPDSGDGHFRAGHVSFISND